jgi:MFS family permease
MTEPSATSSAGLKPATTSVVSADATPARSPRGYLPSLAAGTFGVYLALLTPVLVSLAFKLQHITGSQADATAALGLVTGVGALFALFINPLVGRLSDRTTSRFGRRRPWILGGTLVAVAAFVFMGAATEVWMLLVGWCVVQAALNGVLATVNATVPDQVPVSSRGRASGIIGLMTPLGVLGGSVLVTFLADDFSRLVVPGVIGAVLVLIFVVILRDRPITTPPTERYTAKEFFGSFVFNPAKHPDFGWTWITKFAVMFGYVGVGTFIPFYLVDRFGLDEQTAITTVLMCNLVLFACMAISGPLGGYISDRVGKRRIFVAAAGLIMVIGLVVMAFAVDPTMVIVGQGIIGLGLGSFTSVDLALATQVLPNPSEAAKDLGVLNIANTLPSSVAPIVAPTIIALGSATAIGGYSLFFLFGALSCLIGAVLVFRIKGVQ